MTRVFAISDLHLPGGDDKPMNRFGSQWDNHFERIRDDWLAVVAPSDIVLMPGDFSWAMRVSDAADDLRLVGELPGRKIITRGNHDYWWSSPSSVRNALPQGMYALQNDSLTMDGIVFAGSRGWSIPDESSAEFEQDKKIYDRELIRLDMSLKAARRDAPDLPLVVLLHFPPIYAKRMSTAMSDLLIKYGASHVVYGHLHGGSIRHAVNGVVDGVHYHCVSCDALGFRLMRVM